MRVKRLLIPHLLVITYFSENFTIGTIYRQTGRFFYVLKWGTWVI